MSSGLILPKDHFLVYPENIWIECLHLISNNAFLSLSHKVLNSINYEMLPVDENL